MYWSQKFFGQWMRSQPAIARKGTFKAFAGGGRVISICGFAASSHPREARQKAAEAGEIRSTLDTVVTRSLKGIGTGNAIGRRIGSFFHMAINIHININSQITKGLNNVSRNEEACLFLLQPNGQSSRIRPRSHQLIR